MSSLFSDHNFWIFFLQAFILSMPFPAAFLAYRWARAPQKDKLIERELRQLGVHNTAVSDELESHRYGTRDYVWPVFSASLLVFVIFSMTHPYVINLGIWSGILEEVVDIFGLPHVTKAEAAGRFLFWGFMGAWVYSINLILRRFLTYDLTPGVYVFVVNRFLLAWMIGAIVGLGMGTFSRGAGVAANFNLVNVFIVVFFIGFFPEWGMSWVVATSKRLLGQSGGIAKETRLSAIEGLSIWHQGRLQQEGIENVQNLSAANIPALVISTPFTVGQIVDWVDQAILLVYANDDKYPILENQGIRCASDFLAATDNAESTGQLARASGVSADYLSMLRLSLQAAANINFTSKFRGRYSLDEKRNLLSLSISIFDTAFPGIERAKQRYQEKQQSPKTITATMPAVNLPS